MKKSFKIALFGALLLALAMCFSACQLSDIPEELVGIIPDNIKNLHEHPWDEWLMTYSDVDVSLVCNICKATVKTQPFSEGLDIRDGVLYGIGDCTDKEIVVPYGVTSISNDAFQGKDITGVLLPDTLKSIGNDAFKNCQSMAVIHFPSGLETIGERAFQNCKALVAIVLPNSVKTLGAHSFQNCQLLGAIYYYGVEEDWEKVEKGKDWNKGAGKHAVTYKGVVIAPDGPNPHTHEYVATVTNPTCTEQGYTTYTCACGNSYINNYTDPTEHNFGGWTTTKEPSTTETGLKERVCSVCGKIESEEIPVIEYKPEGSQGLEYELNAGGQSYSVVGIGTCTDTDIVFPSEYNGLPVTKIGKDALDSRIFGWDWYDKTISITIPDSVTEIGTQAFFSGLHFSSINLGNGLKIIGEDAFWGSYCEELYIPASVTTIKSLTFHEFWDMKNYIVDENNPNYKSIDGNLYSKDGKTFIVYAIAKEETTFTIPTHVTTIEAYAFCSNYNLKSIYVHSGVTTIGYEAFSRGLDFESVYYDGTVAQWYSICNFYDPSNITFDYTIYCTDGTIAKDGTVTYN